MPDDDTLETVMAGVTIANALVQLERFGEGAEVIAAVEPPARRVCASPERIFTVATVLFVAGRAHMGLGTPEAFPVAESKLLEAYALAANGPRQHVVGFAFALEQLCTSWCKSAPSPERERQRDEWKARREALKAGK